MSTVLITGANRGIGKALVEKFLLQKWRVIACSREPKQVETDFGSEGNRIDIHHLDVTDQTEVNQLGEFYANQKIDLLLNVAGIYGPSGLRFGNTPVEPWLEVFRVNTIATLKLSEALIESVASSDKKIIAAISSEMGSMTTNQYGNAYLYRSSKAALNSVVKSMSIDLAERGVKTIAIHPGWVLTDLGGPDAKVSPQQSAAGIFKLLTGSNGFKSGGFYDYLGKELPW
ncbi:SDR family oxidoreductase [Aliikangiella coralliicola]|uniref:SDR family oxidoreductase n=1 Tax=Aliikangiella coralliicola TaxID=2592383 RepID=A0A545UCX2_9GAMM|nr:SDR family oxidoreductase [Aliikangiella coralliicola]TQV87315.1 SDR family oxidoreductase [Aliikangiella coralliicola]